MATYAAGSPITIEVVVLDLDNVPITTKTDSDFSETIRHTATDGTRTPATVGTWQHDANGIYYATIASAVVGIYSGTITVAGQPSPYGWEAQVLTAAEYDPASALSGYRVTTVSPIAQSGLLTIKRGDWYNNDDGRALEWIDEDDQWPDLTDALITFAAKPDALRKSTDFILVTGSVIVPTGEGKTIRVELTTPDTETMTPGKWKFDIQAVTSPDGHNVTLVSGPMVLEEDFVP